MKRVCYAILLLPCFFLLGVSTLCAQSEGVNERQLKILEPAEEVQRLDPAFEMIMEKLDGDLKYILSSPVRMTPKGTAVTGLTILGTLFLLNEDEEYLSHIAGSAGESPDYALERLKVLGRNVPGTAAGLYLLGYFFDSRNLKSSSLESLEAVAISALVAASSGYVIGHKGPPDSTNSDTFEPLSKFRSMPDMNSSLIFSMAGVYAYEKPFLEALIYYGIAAGTAYSRLYFEEAWPSDVFLGSVLGTVIGRTVAARSKRGEGSGISLLPVVEQNGRAAIGLKLEFKL